VQSWIDYLNQYSAISERSLRRWYAEYQTVIARTLLAGKNALFAGHQFWIEYIRELNGHEIPTVLARDRRIRSNRPLRVFVGHRFTPAVTSNLRHNLQAVLRPYGITPIYSDSDMPNGAVFDTILKRIRTADFSIFDDRETEVRPNVLIELGAAIGMGRPYFYFNYANKRSVKIGSRREPITTASDLAGMLYLPYATHRELFVQFARHLPAFLVDRSLASQVS
jgi:hypothetical protein